jgi:hypothetical protein
MLDHSFALTAPPARTSRRAGFLRLGAALVLALGAVGCGGSGIGIWVDNGGSDSIVVIVDGKEEATIAPGAFAKLGCEPGERHLQIKSGDKVLFDGTKDLRPSDQLGVGRRFLFNPDHSHRYGIYTVKYGSSPFEGMFDHLGDDPANPPSAVQSAYRKLAKEIELLPPDPWFEITTTCYVLSQPPSLVVTRGGTERRKVLTRIDLKDYALLQAAREKQNPTEADLDALSEVVDRVME